jgi:GAF domain-containing protein
MPRDQSVCAHTVASGNTLVVPDVLRDPRFAAHPWLQEHGFRFYAGAPLRLGEHLLGTLCLLDKQPRTLSKREVLLLEALADDAVAVVREGTVAPRGQAA